MTHATLDEARLYIMEQVPYIQKKGRVKSDKMDYTYATEREYIAKVRPLLVAEQITFDVIDIQPIFASHVKVLWDVKHVPSGEVRRIVSMGDIEAGGKGGYKSQTGAQKYAIKQFLLIETGNDPEKPVPTDDSKLAAAKKWVEDAKTPADIEKKLRYVDKQVKAGEMTADLQAKVLAAIDTKRRQIGA
jgi:hypothetical protein